MGVGRSEILDRIIGDRRPLVDRPPHGYRWGMEHAGEPTIVRVHHFPPESYVVRTLAAGPVGSGGVASFSWVYSEIMGFSRGQLLSRALFSEELQPWEYDTLDRCLAVDPMTIPARQMIDEARAKAGHPPIEYWQWRLGNPTVAATDELAELIERVAAAETEVVSS